MALLLITYVSSLMVLEWSNVKILQKPEYAKHQKFADFKIEMMDFWGLLSFEFYLQLQSKKTKNYALLLWLVHWGYISLESATLQAKIMKSKTVQEDEEEGGKKRKAEAHLASRLWSWPLQIYSGKMQCFLDFFSYVPKAQEF